MNTRRQFLIKAPVAVAALTAACQGQKQIPTPRTTPEGPTAGAPPTFGTAPGVGPDVTPTTFAEAEKLMQVTMTPAQLEQAASSWRSSMAGYLERRTGPRKFALTDKDDPATIWNPLIPGAPIGSMRERFVRANDTV